MKQGIHWLLTDMDQNHDLFPEGYGIMEVYGLNAELIDVAVYTQQALKATAHIAGVLNQPDTAAAYRAAALAGSGAFSCVTHGAPPSSFGSIQRSPVRSANTRPSSPSRSTSAPSNLRGSSSGTAVLW